MMASAMPPTAPNKTYVAIIGAVITALLGTVPPDSTIFEILTAVAAVLTAVGVYWTPNPITSKRSRPTP